LGTTSSLLENEILDRCNITQILNPDSIFGPGIRPGGNIHGIGTEDGDVHALPAGRSAMNKEMQSVIGSNFDNGVGMQIKSDPAFVIGYGNRRCTVMSRICR
jgi:hypothetical protein